MFKKSLLILVTFLVFLFSASSGVSAHVAVKPGEANVGAFQTFSVGVPNERDVATVAVRLVVPEGLEHVTPNVKSGWVVTMKHDESGMMSGEDHDHGKVVEIAWTGGSIPPMQRDDFLFSAKVPADETTLQWKAYQTYADGTIISWDKAASEQPKDANGQPDLSKFGPYSETKVINDLKLKEEEKANLLIAEKKVDFAKTIGIVALLVSVLSLGMSFYWKKK